MARELKAEERALWAKVVATIRPFRSPASPIEEAEAELVEHEIRSDSPALPRVHPRTQPKPVAPSNTLDGSWDRRLSRGMVQPDLTIDLHGHNLATAYALLDGQLEDAIARGLRVVLLITGKPPRDDRRPVARGAIRAAVGDWLAASRHASDIAAVRGAHPRHGGSGALYIVLRRSAGRR